MNLFSKILFVILILYSGLSQAQVDRENKIFRERLDSLMKQKIIESLALDEPTANKFLESYKENNKQIRKIAKEKKELMNTLEMDPSASDMDSKLEQLFDIESRLLEQRRNFFKDLKTFLTPQQIAKTLILRKNFEKELKNQITTQKKRTKFKD